MKLCFLLETAAGNKTNEKNHIKAAGCKTKIMI